MRIGIISEVMSDGYICLHPSSFAQIRNLVLANIDGRISSTFKGDKQHSCIVTFNADGTLATLPQSQSGLDVAGKASPSQSPMVADNDMEGSPAVANNQKTDLVNLVYLQGPMTRNGEECSYGTKEIRDDIMSCADSPYVRGHIIYCDTPGGFASCIQDLRLAVNYAHERGQRVDMIIDGMCASGGAFASALCDHVWFINPEDEIGSIGMYWANFTLADGAQNSISSEVYREYYAQASTHKNEAYRKAAEGDMEGVKAHTEAYLARLIDNLKKDRPSIKAEQMSGEMYKMSDVIGSLVDGQSDLRTVAQSLIDDWHDRNGAALPRKDVAAPAPSAPQQESSQQASVSPMPSPESTQTPKQMKTYTHIPAAIGEGQMESLDGELSLQPEQAEALENFLAAGNQQVEQLQAAIEQLKADHAAEIENLRAAHAAEVEQLNADHAEAVATLESDRDMAISQINADHAAEIERLNAAHAAEIEHLNADHTDALNEQTQQVASLNEQVAALNQQITDLQATIEEVNNAQGREPQAGAAPVNNGPAAPPAPHLVTTSTYDPKLSAAENARRRREADENLRRQANC